MGNIEAAWHCAGISSCMPPGWTLTKSSVAWVWNKTCLAKVDYEKPRNLVKLRIVNVPMEMKYNGRIFPQSSFPWFKTLPFVVAHATAVVALV